MTLPCLQCSVNERGSCCRRLTSLEPAALGLEQSVPAKSESSLPSAKLEAVSRSCASWLTGVVDVSGRRLQESAAHC